MRIFLLLQLRCSPVATTRWKYLAGGHYIEHEAKTWNAIYAQYADPNTRTRAVIMQIEEDYTRINTVIHTVQQQVKTTPW